MIGSNIVERCDVTLSRAIQPLVSDALRVFFFLAYFISVFEYTDFACVEVKDEEDLLLEKTARGKRDVKRKGPAQLIDTCDKYCVRLCRSYHCWKPEIR